MSATFTLTEPIARLLKACSQAPAAEPVRQTLLTAVTLVLFLCCWHIGASKIDTSLGQLPGPAQVYAQAQSLWSEHRAERSKEAAFYQRQSLRNEQKLARDPAANIKWRDYRGRPTFVDQIGTSLLTAFVGFLLASLVAVPLGILCGLSQRFYNSVNPIIQVFKPISPLAWLPLVTMVVSAVYVTDDPWLAKSFLVSAITVTLCCLWPTLINTTVAVSSVDQDLLNVSRVLRLSAFAHIRKIVIPAAVPGIFTGLRLSLSVGWMVLIAAEMLAQNPGLGKFVWDEFQNGSSQSLARIMVAVFAIGIIGFALDRSMLALQKIVSWDKNSALR